MDSSVRSLWPLMSPEGRRAAEPAGAAAVLDHPEQLHVPKTPQRRQYREAGGILLRLPGTGHEYLFPIGDISHQLFRQPRQRNAGLRKPVLRRRYITQVRRGETQIEDRVHHAPAPRSCRSLKSALKKCQGVQVAGGAGSRIANERCGSVSSCVEATEFPVAPRLNGQKFFASFLQKRRPCFLTARRQPAAPAPDPCAPR